ncbi:MAG: hypothetical protein J3R72DRAFT_456721 [Linnemannia gamsii]|nr:MAG: hypothetical protein J3R72DRAFT_456721 [Linnemannia gamsii]
MEYRAIFQYRYLTRLAECTRERWKRLRESEGNKPECSNEKRVWFHHLSWCIKLLMNTNRNTLHLPSIMSISLNGRQHTLEDFKAFSPDDLSPVAFFSWTQGTSEDKEKLHLAYVSLYTQAKRSPVPKIRKAGLKMERMWRGGKPTVDSYWDTKSLKKLRSKNVIAAARNSSSLQIAVGKQQLKDALRELQDPQPQQSFDGRQAQDRQVKTSQKLSASDQQQQTHEQPPLSSEQRRGTLTTELLGNELTSNPSDSDYQPTTGTSARTSLSTIDFHYHNNLTGPGETSCRLRTTFKCIFGDLDVSEQLMSARKEMIKQQCTLQSAADLLSLNFIFTKAFLEDNLPSEAVTCLTRQPTSAPKSEDVELLLVCCLHVGTTDYLPGRAYLKDRTARQDSVTSDIISSYASSGVLRNRVSNLAFNENTYIEQSVKPFVTGTFAQLDFQEHWIIDPFPVPTGYEERLFPDFYGEKDGLPFVVLEVKPPDADPDDCDVDVRKVTLLMKLSLNRLLEAGVKDPVVIGLLVQDRRCEIFTMDLAYEAVYIPKVLGTFEVPENKLQLPLLLHALGPLTTAKEIASNTLAKITDRPRRVPSEKNLLIRSSFYLRGVKIPEPVAPAVAL